MHKLQLTQEQWREEPRGGCGFCHPGVLHFKERCGRRRKRDRAWGGWGRDEEMMNDSR